MATPDPVKSVDLSGLSSSELTALSRRCLSVRKALNGKARAKRTASEKAKLAARKAKLEKALAELSA